MPIGRLIPLIDDDIAQACRQLSVVRSGLATSTSWMVGAQFFLRRDVRLCTGHVLYLDSPWALTSISQRQFWSRNGKVLADEYGRGDLGGIISVDISDWDAIAPRLGRTAKECTREEILDETFRQIMDGLNSECHEVIRPQDVIDRHLDSSIEFEASSGIVSRNKTPLFVHDPGTFQYRPSVLSNISNLSLASDFVATDTNLASMEGANEAARRAVRAIMYKADVQGTKPFVRPLPEPSLFLPFKRMDGWLVQNGMSAGHAFEVGRNELSELIQDTHQSEVTSVQSLGRSLDLQTKRPPHVSRSQSIDRIHSTLQRMRYSLNRAERLISRRSFQVQRSRSNSPHVRRPSAVSKRPSKLPSQAPPKM